MKEDATDEAIDEIARKLALTAGYGLGLCEQNKTRIPLHFYDLLGRVKFATDEYFEACEAEERKESSERLKAKRS